MSGFYNTNYFPQITPVDPWASSLEFQKLRQSQLETEAKQQAPEQARLKTVADQMQNALTGLSLDQQKTQWGLLKPAFEFQARVQADDLAKQIADYNKQRDAANALTPSTLPAQPNALTPTTTAAAPAPAPAPAPAQTSTAPAEHAPGAMPVMQALDAQGNPTTDPAKAVSWGPAPAHAAPLPATTAPSTPPPLIPATGVPVGQFPANFGQPAAGSTMTAQVLPTDTTAAPPAAVAAVHAALTTAHATGKSIPLPGNMGGFANPDGTLGPANAPIGPPITPPTAPPPATRVAAASTTATTPPQPPSATPGAKPSSTARATNPPAAPAPPPAVPAGPPKPPPVSPDATAADHLTAAGANATAPSDLRPIIAQGIQNPEGHSPSSINLPMYGGTVPLGWALTIMHDPKAIRDWQTYRRDQLGMLAASSTDNASWNANLKQAWNNGLVNSGEVVQYADHFDRRNQFIGMMLSPEQRASFYANLAANGLSPNPQTGQIEYNPELAAANARQRGAIAGAEAGAKAPYDEPYQAEVSDDGGVTWHKQPIARDKLSDWLAGKTRGVDYRAVDGPGGGAIKAVAPISFSYTENGETKTAPVQPGDIAAFVQAHPGAVETNMSGKGLTADDYYNAFRKNENSGANERSDAGAMGSMQIMPETFRQYRKGTESYDNEKDRVTVAKRYIDALRQKYPNDPLRVATAYFSGEDNVAPAGSPTPWKVDTNDKHQSVSDYVANFRNNLGLGTGATARATAPPPAATTGTQGPPVFTLPQQKALEVQTKIAEAKVEAQLEGEKKRFGALGDQEASIIRASGMSSNSLQKLTILDNAAKLFTPGILPEKRAAAMKAFASSLELLGVPRDRIPAAMRDGSMGEELIGSVGVQLAQELTSRLGSNEASNVFNTILASKPNAFSSPQGFQALTASLRAGVQRDIDINNFRLGWRQDHPGPVGADMDGMQAAFDAKYPPEVYASRVVPLEMPTDKKAFKRGVRYSTPAMDGSGRMEVRTYLGDGLMGAPE